MFIQTLSQRVMETLSTSPGHMTGSLQTTWTEETELVKTSQKTMKMQNVMIFFYRASATQYC